MSALAERPARATLCPECGAPLASDQEWCLECGTAVAVRIRPAPDWRVPVAVVGGVVVLAVLGLLIALVSLSNTADRSVAAAAAAAPATPAAAQPATSQPAAPAPATTPAPPPPPSVATWPRGMTGYTVVLGVIPAKQAATARATKIAATGIPVGVLYSSHYSSMRPGDWIVFSGTYTTMAEADAAATHLQAKGQPGAYAFSVVPAH